MRLKISLLLEDGSAFLTDEENGDRYVSGGIDQRIECLNQLKRVPPSLEPESLMELRQVPKAFYQSRTFSSPEEARDFILNLEYGRKGT